jgi:hypothetical protein
MMILDDIINMLNDKENIDYNLLKDKINEVKTTYLQLLSENNQLQAQNNRLETSAKSLESAVMKDQSVIYRLTILSSFSVIISIILLIRALSK